MYRMFHGNPDKHRKIVPWVKTRNKFRYCKGSPEKHSFRYSKTSDISRVVVAYMVMGGGVPVIDFLKYNALQI